MSEFSCFTSGGVVMENLTRIPVHGSAGEVWGTLTDCLVIIYMAVAHGVPVLGLLSPSVRHTSCQKSSFICRKKICTIV